MSAEQYELGHCEDCSELMLVSKFHTKGPKVCIHGTEDCSLAYLELLGATNLLGHKRLPRQEVAMTAQAVLAIVMYVGSAGGTGR